MKTIKKILLIFSLVLLLDSVFLFVQGNIKEGAIQLFIFWIVLAIAFLQNEELKKFTFTVVILAVVTAAMTFPQYFISFGDFQLKKLIVPLLQIITFGVGCSMNWNDFSGVVKTPRSVIIGVILQFLVMPFVGLAIASSFGFKPEIAAGIVLVGCMPGGLASNVMAYIARANVALSVTLTSVSTLLAPIMTPLLMKFIGGQFIPINFMDMFFDVIKLVIIPIFIGITFNHFFGKRLEWIKKIMPLISMGGIACIIMVITAAGRDNMLEIGMVLVFAMFLHMTVGSILGYFSAKLFGLSKIDCRTIAIEVGMQNGGLASGIAAQMGKIATLGLAPAVNGPVMNTTFSLISTWWGRKNPADETKN